MHVSLPQAEYDLNMLPLSKRTYNNQTFTLQALDELAV